MLSGFDMETALTEHFGAFDEKTENYLGSLSEVQRRIVEMKMEEIPSGEIKKRLGLSDKQYKEYCKELKSFTKLNILYKNERTSDTEERKQMNNTLTQTMEKSKPNRLSIASIIKKIDRYTIRFDHPLQRESEQWSPSMKGNLISDILQGNHIPSLVFAEQIVNGIAIIWDLDGKQRCTNVYSFSKDGYKISKNIRRWMIEYQAPVVDEEGNTVFDSENFPLYERKEFDIRGKKFSELPEELQERFFDYNFEIVQYLNCSGEDIAYHIARYNEGKPMSASQKGLTRLGEEYAGMVKSISSMPFFKDMGGYKVSEFKNGTVNRVVTESVMAANYLSDWKKNLEDMCEYIKNNASAADFEDFEDMVGRLENVVTDDAAEMFDSKDSFLWFGLFARFAKYEKDDNKFIEFMAEFSRSLHSKAVDGTTYDELCMDKKTGKPRSTKDKYIVVPKMKLLEKLMLDYLDIDKKGMEDTDVLEFVRENVNPKAEKEDVGLQEENLDAWTVGIPAAAKIRDDKNKPSMIAITAYAFEKEESCDDETMIAWFADYESRNKMFIRNQKKNYLHMKTDLERFLCHKRI